MEMPGEKLVISMWETLARGGIGSLLAPWQIRRVGKATAESKAEEMLVLARAQQEANRILSGENRHTIPVLVDFVQSAGEPRLLETTLPLEVEASRNAEVSRLSPIEDRVQRAARANAIRQEVNVAYAVLEAEQSILDDGATDQSRPPDDDWLHRWRDHAAGAGQEHFRKLWGAVLAGETKKPGAFSYRTMDFLRNLSLEEARSIERLASVVTEGFISPKLAQAIPETGLGFDQLIALQTIGVLEGVSGLGLKRFWNAPEGQLCRIAISCQEKMLYAEATAPGKNLELSGVAMVTTVGLDVLKLCTVPANDAYLRGLGEQIKALGVKVSYGDYRKEVDGTFTLPDSIEL